jgi:hypothetical protein
MTVKLHRDRIPVRVDGHPCWRVEKALREAGVPYEVVHEPTLRSRRLGVIAATGQPYLPAIELEDGRWLYGSSSELAERIRAGALHNPAPVGV